MRTAAPGRRRPERPGAVRFLVQGESFGTGTPAFLPGEHGYGTGHARLVLENIVVGYLASSTLVTNMR